MPSPTGFGRTRLGLLSSPQRIVLEPGTLWSAPVMRSGPPWRWTGVRTASRSPAPPAPRPTGKRSACSSVGSSRPLGYRSAYFRTPAPRLGGRGALLCGMREVTIGCRARSAGGAPRPVDGARAFPVLVAAPCCALVAPTATPGAKWHRERPLRAGSGGAYVSCSGTARWYRCPGQC